MKTYQSMRVRRARVAGGFTLIELLLVMMIIAILATVVATRLIGQGEKARIVKAQADIASIKTALQKFEIDNGRLPTTDENIQALVTNVSNLPGWSKCLDVSTVPMDPWNHPYVYRCPSNTAGNDYDILSMGPDGQEGTADDIKPQ